MSFYRYYDTLGESSSAIVANERRRAFRRQVAIESAVLLLTALIALAVAGRLLFLDATTTPSLAAWLTAIRAFL